MIALSVILRHQRVHSLILCVCTKERPCKDASQGEDSHQKPNPANPWSGALSFQNCVKIIFCCLSHAVCGISYVSPYKLIKMNAKKVAETICAEQECVGGIRYPGHEEEENTV